jgi:hypothetical protein
MREEEKGRIELVASNRRGARVAGGEGRREVWYWIATSVKKKESR